MSFTGAFSRWRAMVFLTLVLLLAGLHACYSILSFYDANESLYMVAGWMVAHGQRVYTDFPFWQMPYSPWIYGGIFFVFQPESFLLAGKMVSFFLWILAQVFLALIFLNFNKSKILCLLLLSAVSLNGIMLRCAMEASNYIMPMTFSLGGILFLIKEHSSPGKERIFSFLSGIFFGLAIGSKLYYLPVGIIIPAVMLYLGRARAKIGFWKKPAFYFGGMVLALVPVWFLFLRDPALFWLNNVQAHHFTEMWWKEVVSLDQFKDTTWSRPITLGQKILYTVFVATEPGNIAALFVFGASVVLCRRMGVFLGKDNLGLWAVLILTVSLFSALVPTPLWQTYFGMPFAFLVAFNLIFLGRLALSQKHLVGILGAIWLLASIVFLMPQLTAKYRLFAHPDTWPVYIISEESRKLALLAKKERVPRLLSFQQIYAIESHYFVPYPGFAYAPFTWVIADRLTDSDRLHSWFWGPNELRSLVKKDSPQCILLGIYPEYLDFPWREDELRKFAEERHYSVVPLGGDLRARFMP